jgi:putative ABC transport system permease protein
LLTYMVVQRAREIGVRTALGATRRDIVTFVVRKGAWRAGAGVALGVIVSVSASSAMASLLYDIHLHDWSVFLAAPALLLAVALLASYVPARRAAELDPLIALREN